MTHPLHIRSGPWTKFLAVHEDFLSLISIRFLWLVHRQTEPGLPVYRYNEPLFTIQSVSDACSSDLLNFIYCFHIYWGYIFCCVLCVCVYFIECSKCPIEVVPELSFLILLFYMSFRIISELPIFGKIGVKSTVTGISGTECLIIYLLCFTAEAILTADFNSEPHLAYHVSMCIARFTISESCTI